MDKRSYVINGLYLSNTKRFIEFYFGQFYIDCQINRQKGIFEVRVRKNLHVKKEDGTFEEVSIEDYVDINHFKKHWNKIIDLLMYEENNQTE